MIKDLMWLHPHKAVLYIDDDLGDYLQEMSFEVGQNVLTEETFAEFWELVLEWQKEVQR